MKRLSRTFTVILISAGFMAFQPQQAKADCQEGVLHKLVRTVFEVPAAVFNSFKGPECCIDDYGTRARVRYPDLRTVYGVEYRLSSEELYEPLPAPPQYVTYKVITPPKRQVRPATRVNLHVYSSIPFQNR